MNSIEDIQNKITSQKAKVFTASEIKKMVRDNKKIGLEDVDVVTCGTFGIMSGTMAILTIPVCEPDIFKKADMIKLNGVPATPGPCPNENLGVVDCIVYGTSSRDMRYGGGHLFKDIVAGKEIDVEVISSGKKFKNTVNIDEMTTARMILTRGAFKNYSCFVNEREEISKTIFAGLPGLTGNLLMASISGCGEINPIQNDPKLRSINEGAKIMINGATGTVIGTGTRSTVEKPNLSAYANMKEMDVDLMGGFITSVGPECLTSVAAAIPIDDEILSHISVLDENIPLPIADVSDRKPKCFASYGDVWQGTSICDIVNLNNCIECDICNADKCCPVEAKPSTRAPENDRCMRCGLCISTCVNKRFTGNLGHISISGTDVPIGLRQSDRVRGEIISRKLKELIQNGKWKLRV